MEIFSGCSKTGQGIIHHGSSPESVTVYCIWCWAGLRQQDHNNMLIVHHYRDIISRITLWWNWLRPPWMIQSDVRDFEILCSFRLQSVISIVLLCVACTWSWMQKWAKLCFPQLPLQKKWANTRAHKQQARRHLLQRMSEDAAVKLVANSKQQLRGHTVPWPHRVAAPLPSCLAQQAPSDTHTRSEIVGQIHGWDLNVVWNLNPIILRFLSSQKRKISRPIFEAMNSLQR